MSEQETLPTRRAQTKVRPTANSMQPHLAKKLPWSLEHLPDAPKDSGSPADSPDLVEEPLSGGCVGEAAHSYRRLGEETFGFIHLLKA